MSSESINSRVPGRSSNRVMIIVRKSFWAIFLMGLILLAFLPYLEYPLEIWLRSIGLNVDIANPFIHIIGSNNYALKMIVSILLSGLGVSIVVYILYKFTEDLEE